MIEMRQQSSNTAMNAAVTGLTEAVRSMGQSVSESRPEDMRVGKPEPYAPGKDFDDWDFTFNGYAGTLDPAYPALLQTARQSPTVVMATPPHKQQSATLLYLLTMLTQKGARKVVRKAGNNGFEAYRQLCLMYGTSDQAGSTGLFAQIMTYKFGSKIEDVEDLLNEFLELVRRYDEANGTDPVPDQGKKACIISNTPEPLKTHLQLNVAKLGNFNAIRVATEDYLRSRRIFKTTLQPETHTMKIQWKSMQSPEKGKAKKNPARTRKVAKKATQAMVTGKRQQSTRASKVNVEIAERTDTKQLIVGTSRRPNLKVKARARESRNPKWQKSVKVTTEWMKKKHVTKMKFIVLKVIPIGIIPDSQTRLSDGCSELMLFPSREYLLLDGYKPL